MRITLAVLLVAAVSSTYSWNIPNLPSGRRSQYYVLHNDGGYKYGYDTGSNHFAKQSGDAQNEVSGHYMYRDNSGRPVDIRYTAGVRGFVPEGLQGLQQPSGPYAPVHPYSNSAPTAYSSPSSSDDEANTGDSSYNFSIDTDTYQRQESSDANGNVQGRYSYSNEAGHHDLSYTAGAQTGFVATSGSLAQPNGLLGQTGTGTTRYASGRNFPTLGSSDNTVNTDGSYSFGFATNDQSRQESSDASGNVQGRYSYTNAAGTHDLSYVAGSATGFQPTGGNLHTVSSLPHSSFPSPVSVYSGPSVDNTNTNSIINPDGSYSFSYSTNDQSRQESSDASGNVQGRYSFTNEAGNHDLSYVAGSATGFQPTGGNLAVPNGLNENAAPVAPVSTYSAPVSSQSSMPIASYESNSSPDGSYSFAFTTGDQSRQESSDSSGNVQGRYSYTNEAGSHDLSYVAGSQTGFMPTGGNLAVPNGLEGNSVSSVPTTYSAPLPQIPTTYSGAFDENSDDQANTGDSSYSFTVDTPEYQRQETSDAQGNVRGSFSYRNTAGQHDLSFVAGSQTGFQPTGGSLAQPNGLAGNDVSSPSGHSVLETPNPVVSYSSNSQENEDDQANTGDASYSFTVDTPEYQRHESSDPQGNVRGRFSYTNRAGAHDLSYVAGSSTGFVATGGSLATPNGLGSQGANPVAIPITTPVSVPAASVRFLPPQARASVIRSDNSVANVRTYLPPQSSSKYGYVYES